MVSRADASFNISRAALLVHALTHDPSLLFIGTQDRLHQDSRRSVYPDSMALVDELRAAGLPAVISGAGPTVLVFGTAGDIEVVKSTAGEQWQVSERTVARLGVHNSPVMTP
jgi:homoserine kinase